MQSKEKKPPRPAQSDVQPAPAEHIAPDHSAADGPLDLPDAPADLPMPMSAEEGVEAEDTSFLYGNPNDAVEPTGKHNSVPEISQPDHEAEMRDVPVDPTNGDCMMDMVVLMDTLQALLAWMP